MSQTIWTQYRADYSTIFQWLPPLVAFLTREVLPSSKEIGSVLDDPVPRAWLRDGDFVSPLNQAQCHYIETLPTASTLEDVEPELEKFSSLRHGHGPGKWTESCPILMGHSRSSSLF